MRRGKEEILGQSDVGAIWTHVKSRKNTNRRPGHSWGNGTKMTRTNRDIISPNLESQSGSCRRTKTNLGCCALKSLPKTSIPAALCVNYFKKNQINVSVSHCFT